MKIKNLVSGIFNNTVYLANYALYNGNYAPKGKIMEFKDFWRIGDFGDKF